MESTDDGKIVILGKQREYKTYIRLTTVEQKYYLISDFDVEEIEEHIIHYSSIDSNRCIFIRNQDSFHIVHFELLRDYCGDKNSNHTNFGPVFNEKKYKVTMLVEVVDAYDHDYIVKLIQVLSGDYESEDKIKKCVTKIISRL